MTRIPRVGRGRDEPPTNKAHSSTLSRRLAPNSTRPFCILRSQFHVQSFDRVSTINPLARIGHSVAIFVGMSNSERAVNSKHVNNQTKMEIEKALLEISRPEIDKNASIVLNEPFQN